MQDPVKARALTIAGEAYAHNSMGELRLLDVGDELVEGETVFTPEGSEVELQLADGSIVVIRESSRREIDRSLLRERAPVHTVDLSGSPRPAPRNRARFSEIADGEPVRSACGRNLFFNEKPLYWSIDAECSRAAAIAHVAGDGEFVDHIALQMNLGGSESCKISVSEGQFAVEHHNIPFTTGEPEPGHPVKFFGIADDGDASVDEADEGLDLMSAEVGNIGVTNLWSREGDRVQFQFLPAEGARQPRAINNFTFRNTGSGQAAFVARAYQSGRPEPVYQVGSREMPVKVAPGSVFSVVAQNSYDRLEVVPVADCASCDLGMSLHLESYSEFSGGDVAMSVEVTGTGSVGETADGRFLFTLEADGSGHRELSFEMAAQQGPYDSIWEQLGLQSGDPREQH